MGASLSSSKRRHDRPQPPMLLPPTSHPVAQPDYAPSSSNSTPPVQNFTYSPNPNPSNFSYTPNPNPSNFSYTPNPNPSNFSYTPNPNPSNISHTPYPIYHAPSTMPPPPPPTSQVYNMYAAPPPPAYQAPYHGGGYSYNYNYNNYNHCGGGGGGGYGGPPPYFANQYNGWGLYRPPQLPVPGIGVMQGVMPKFVGHQNAKKVKNYVNVRKDGLKVEVDGEKADQYLVSFLFDAEHDGSITVYYFAKVEDDCKISPLFPEAYTPVKVPFQKGSGQTFQQASGTGIDLGFFEFDDLAKPSPAEDVFPLVIAAETSLPTDELSAGSAPAKSPPMQITQAVLIKKDAGFQVKVIKQILWIDEVRYELREIFGIGNSSTAESSKDDKDEGEECVICLTEPKDTAVLPCRHMCMCSDCAKALRLQSNKCPICRQSIEEIIEIKIENSDS